LPPSSGTCSLYSHRDSPALMMEAIRSSETSVLTKNTRRKISEDGFLHSHRRENLKSYDMSSTSQWPSVHMKSRVKIRNVWLVAYNKYRCSICGDFKVTGPLLGMQLSLRDLDAPYEDGTAVREVLVLWKNGIVISSFFVVKKLFQMIHS
jgi:hypothetical protein